MAFAVLALVIVAGAVVAIRFSASGHRTDGPLAPSDEVAIRYELDAGQSTTWGMPLEGSLGQTAVLTLVEPLSVEGLDVLGVQTCSGATKDGDNFLHCAPLNAGGWPLPNVVAREVAGTVVDGTAISSVGILIGLELQPAASGGSVSGVRVVYTVDGTTYEVVQPWALRLVPPGELETEKSPAGGP